MPVFRETAFAKINLALHVRKRRADGYHELETLFAFAEDGDVLTVKSAAELTLTITGPFGPRLSAGDDNLVLKAAHALRVANGIETGAALHLEKRLPIAAGIGGGSADAAAALRLLGRFWQVDLGSISGASLGADVPACLDSVPCFGRGVGDQLTPVDDAALSGMPLLLVNPRVACLTGPVFAAWDGVDRGALSVEDWAKARNDLTAPALARVPQIADVLDALRQCSGTRLVRMSGSGATCFALFESLEARDVAAASLNPAWWQLSTRLRKTGRQLDMG
jgi:4-diphosphocytidyl-2-C-methyl-D-erythritol kinase